MILTRGLTRFAAPNNPRPGSVFTRRRTPSFAGYPRVRHGCSVARESSDGLGSPKPPHPGRPPRLGEKAVAVTWRKRLNSRTEEAYLSWMRRYWEFLGRRDPAAHGAPKVTAFPSSLATDRRVAASTQNHVPAAVLFLYREVLSLDLPWLEGAVRAKTPQRFPTVLTRAEGRTVLDRIATPVPRLMATLLYGAGLRLLECCRP